MAYLEWFRRKLGERFDSHPLLDSHFLVGESEDDEGNVRVREVLDDGAGVQVVLVVEDETVHFHNQVADL